MSRNPLDLALAPARLAGRVVGGVARSVTGGGSEPPPPPPKDLDDVTIARKVESEIFRDRRVAKGKVDVNVAEGVVWLRGEVKTPALVNQLEAKARAVPEVRGVENLLHLPKTDAPSRTDTPSPQRKTRRTKRSPGARTVTPGKVTDEQPPPPGAEPSPRTTAARGKGRKPAPLGANAQDDSARDDKGPDVAELDKDPAYNPTDPGLRDLKGG